MLTSEYLDHLHDSSGLYCIIQSATQICYLFDQALEVMQHNFYHSQASCPDSRSRKYIPSPEQEKEQNKHQHKGCMGDGWWDAQAWTLSWDTRLLCSHSFNLAILHVPPIQAHSCILSPFNILKSLVQQQKSRMLLFKLCPGSSGHRLLRQNSWFSFFDTIFNLMPLKSRNIISTTSSIHQLKNRDTTHTVWDRYHSEQRKWESTQVKYLSHGSLKLVNWAYLIILPRNFSMLLV